MTDTLMQTVATVEEFEHLKHKRILFAISLGESGINLEFYPILKKIRMERNCFEGSVGGIIVDGQSDLFTKSVGRELVFQCKSFRLLLSGEAAGRRYQVAAKLQYGGSKTGC